MTGRKQTSPLKCRLLTHRRRLRNLHSRLKPICSDKLDASFMHAAAGHPPPSHGKRPLAGDPQKAQHLVGVQFGLHIG